MRELPRWAMESVVRSSICGSRPMAPSTRRTLRSGFDLGADLCTPDTGEKLEYEPLRIVEPQVDRLEREIDELNAELSPLRSFVLPGGSAASAALHVARTVCRRAERQMVELSMTPTELVGEPALKYINRLSDFLFVASRYVNRRGAGDVLWTPGKNR